MNKVIAVNLNGNAYQLEEAGYERLRAYLDSATANLAGNPDRDEILADIEQAIADKFRASLGAHKTVVATRDVERVIGEMGSVPGGVDAGSGATSVPPPPPPSAGTPRRLYLIHEGAMIGGVCNGIAAYFGLDVSIVRVIFAITALLYGTGILAYILLMLIVPSATTPEQKEAAHGLNRTAQEFIRRAKAGYYQGMKTWGDKRAHREWRRKFKADMRGMGQQIKQEVRDAKCEWRQHWHGWGWHGPAVPAAWPILKALEILFVIVLLLVIFHHGFWGWWGWHFGGMPWWLAIVILILLFKLITLPLRMACWGGPYYRHPAHSAVETLIGLLVVVLVIGLLNRHVPEFHQFLNQLPDFFRYVGDSVHNWWVTHVH